MQPAELEVSCSVCGQEELWTASGISARIHKTWIYLCLRKRFFNLISHSSSSSPTPTAALTLSTCSATFRPALCVAFSNLFLYASRVSRPCMSRGSSLNSRRWPIGGLPRFSGQEPLNGHSDIYEAIITLLNGIFMSVLDGFSHPQSVPGTTGPAKNIRKDAR